MGMIGKKGDMESVIKYLVWFVLVVILLGAAYFIIKNLTNI